MKTEIDFDKLVTEAMKQEPTFNLPLNFADVVAEKGISKFGFKKNMNEYFFYAAIVAGLALFVAGFFYFISKENFQQITDFIANNLVSILSVLFIANFILFADKVLLRQLFYMKK